MANDINIANDLYDLLATHNFDVEAADKSGNPVSPTDARIFKFDWVSSGGTNYGTAVIVIGEEDDLMLFFGDNLGKGMEEPDKSEWYAFLQQMANFSTRHGFHTFSPKNLNALKHTMTGLAAIKEGLFESYYGTRRVSYMGEPTDARLVINHNRVLGEDDKRYRYVESLFIETADGEKFKMQFRNLSGGRAMLEHVRQGGKPYDVRGQHITEIVQEMAVLARFHRASRGRVFEAQTQQLVEQAQTYYRTLQNSLKHLSSHRGYTQYFESWSPTEGLEGEALVEDLKTMFIEQTLDARIEDALPTLAKLQQQGERMKEAEIFESWANRLVEGTWALPETPEQQAKLNDLMSKELIVGPDATNATEQLYDVIGDDQLFDSLQDLASRDPRANVWDDTDVQKRLQELGIQLPGQTPTPDQQAATPPVAGTTAPAPAAQPPVTEGDNLATFEELNSMLKHAGVPVAEGRILDEGGETLQHILDRFKNEVRRFEAGDELDSDLYDALFDYYASRGDMPYGTMKARTGDPFEWITDRLDQELGTGNHAPRSPNPVAEGSCNMTAEGEYCPEHGLAECGGMYEEENQFGPAATAAIQQGKSPTEVHYADSGDKLNAGFHNTMM
jgi:hypothetical protein